MRQRRLAMRSMLATASRPRSEPAAPDPKRACVLASQEASRQRAAAMQQAAAEAAAAAKKPLRLEPAACGFEVTVGAAGWLKDPMGVEGVQEEEEMDLEEAPAVMPVLAAPILATPVLPAPVLARVVRPFKGWLQEPVDDDLFRWRQGLHGALGSSFARHIT